MKAFVDRCIFCNYMPVKYWQHDDLTFKLDCPMCYKGLIHKELYQKRATWTGREGKEISKRFGSLGGKRMGKYVLVKEKTGLFTDRVEITIEDLISYSLIEGYVDLNDGSTIHFEADQDIWHHGNLYKIRRSKFSKDDVDRIRKIDAFRVRTHSIRIYNDWNFNYIYLKGFKYYNEEWVVFELDEEKNLDEYLKGRIQNYKPVIPMV